MKDWKDNSYHKKNKENTETKQTHPKDSYR